MTNPQPISIDLDLIEQIHDVALGRSSWADVLGRLRAEFSAELSSLRVYGQGFGQTRTLASAGFDGRPWHQYVAHFAAIDPFAAAMRTGAMPAGIIMHGDPSVPGKRFCATEFYHDWFRPNGLRHGAGAFVRTVEGSYLQLGMPRSPRAGPYSADEIVRLQRYFNHIRRALLIQEELQARIKAPDFDQVALAFDLTAAEAKFIEGLATATSLKRLAQSTNRSYYTLRAHLRSVFRKTGTHRQTELMRLIHQGSHGAEQA